VGGGGAFGAELDDVAGQVHAHMKREETTLYPLYVR
jgi:hypothetical protein